MSHAIPTHPVAAGFAFAFATLVALGLGACDSGDPDPLAMPEEAPDSAQEPAGGEHVVVLDSVALSVAGIRLVPVTMSRTNTLPATGTITYDATRVSHVGPKTEGRIVQQTADLGSRVGQGDPLVILESTEVGALRAELRAAETLAEIAGEIYEREVRLEAQGISSRRELLDARAEMQRAQAALESATAQLEILGATSGQGGEFAIVAPFDGVVVEKHASRGEVVGPTDQIFTIADLSRLWIELDIFERNLGQVAPGQAVEVTTAAYPNQSFAGRIAYLGDTFDPVTRTVRARVEIANPDGRLRPGMFARARIEAAAGGGAEVVSVPDASVQTIEGQPSVFVRGQRAGEFRAVPVQLGESLGAGRIAVLSGLQPGDEVVVEGAFLLRSELARSEIGEGGHAH